VQRGLRIGVFWLVVALLLPPRVLMLAVGTIIFTSHIRHTRWPTRFRTSEESAHDPYRFASRYAAERNAHWQ